MACKPKTTNAYNDELPYIGFEKCCVLTPSISNKQLKIATKSKIVGFFLTHNDSTVIADAQYLTKRLPPRGQPPRPGSICSEPDVVTQSVGKAIAQSDLCHQSQKGARHLRKFGVHAPYESPRPLMPSELGVICPQGGGTVLALIVAYSLSPLLSHSSHFLERKIRKTVWEPVVCNVHHLSTRAKTSVCFTCRIAHSKFSNISVHVCWWHCVCDRVVCLRPLMTLCVWPCRSIGTAPRPIGHRVSAAAARQWAGTPPPSLSLISSPSLSNRFAQPLLLTTDHATYPYVLKGFQYSVRQAVVALHNNKIRTDTNISGALLVPKPLGWCLTWVMGDDICKIKLAVRDVALMDFVSRLSRSNDRYPESQATPNQNLLRVAEILVSFGQNLLLRGHNFIIIKLERYCQHRMKSNNTLDVPDRRARHKSSEDLSFVRNDGRTLWQLATRQI